MYCTDLCEKEGGVRHEDEEGALQQRVGADVGELGQQRRDAAHH